MFNPTDVIVRDCIKRLAEGYRRTYKNLNPDYAELLHQIATFALEAIAASDAPYHDIEHTILVTLVGQEILRGKQLLEGNVSPTDWLHFIISLLCHDIGYVRGVCRDDRVADRLYTTGLDGQLISLPAGATDASLTPYHVDRGQQVIQDRLVDNPLVKVELIQQNIELTRFPVPNSELHQDLWGYPGLARAADLIGQLSDPRYLQKLPALFYEFEETGANQHLGYRNPDDLRTGFPTFFRNIVYPYIRGGLRYLKATPDGRGAIANLYSNVMAVEEEICFVGAA